MAIYSNENRTRLIFRRKNDLVFNFLSNGKEIQVNNMCYSIYNLWWYTSYCEDILEENQLKQDIVFGSRGNSEAVCRSQIYTFIESGLYFGLNWG